MISDKMNPHSKAPFNDDKKVDIHVLVVPSSHWKTNLRIAHTNTCSKSTSVGFVRVFPDITLAAMKSEVSKQLDCNLLPKSYTFLRNIGHCLTWVSPKQEATLKVRLFLPPLAPCPEIYVLDSDCLKDVDLPQVKKVTKNKRSATCADDPIMSNSGRSYCTTHSMTDIPYNMCYHKPHFSYQQPLYSGVCNCQNIRNPLRHQQRHIDHSLPCTCDTTSRRSTYNHYDVAHNGHSQLKSQSSQEQSRAVSKSYPGGHMQQQDAMRSPSLSYMVHSPSLTSITPSSSSNIPKRSYQSTPYHSDRSYQNSADLGSRLRQGYSNTLGSAGQKKISYLKPPGVPGYRSIHRVDKKNGALQRQSKIVHESDSESNTTTRCNTTDDPHSGVTRSSVQFVDSSTAISSPNHLSRMHNHTSSKSHTPSQTTNHASRRSSIATDYSGQRHASDYAGTQHSDTYQIRSTDPYSDNSPHRSVQDSEDYTSSSDEADQTHYYTDDFWHTQNSQLLTEKAESSDKHSSNSKKKVKIKVNAGNQTSARVTQPSIKKQTVYNGQVKRPNLVKQGRIHSPSEPRGIGKTANKYTGPQRRSNTLPINLEVSKPLAKRKIDYPSNTKSRRIFSKANTVQAKEQPTQRDGREFTAAPPLPPITVTGQQDNSSHSSEMDDKLSVPDVSTKPRASTAETNELLGEIRKMKEECNELSLTKANLSSALRNVQMVARTQRERADNEWKRKYFQEKKMSTIIEEKIRKIKNDCQLLQSELGRTQTKLHKGSIQNSTISSQAEPPSESSNVKIQCKRHELDINQLKSRLENVKHRLSAEKKARRSTVGECKSLREELIKKKISFSRRKTKQITANS